MTKKKHLVTASIVYFVLWFFIAHFLIHGINPDSVSYISIAKKYFGGHFFEAVNAYWGPLFSWLLVPSFLLKIEPHIFARILFVIVSILLFNIVDKFLTKLKLNEQVRNLAVYSLIIPAVFFSFYRLTPDYLLLLFTLIYVYVISQETYFENQKLIFISSLLGACLYFTKSYGLVYFFVMQTLVLVFKFFEDRKISVKNLNNYLLSIMIFVLIISPWVLILSYKYSGFTLSTSGAINIRFINPELNFRHPSIESGFVAPPDKYATSAWDDPDIKYYPDWSPFSSFDNFKHFALNTVKNILKLLAFILAFSPLVIPFLFLLKRRDLSNHLLSKILIAGLIYGLGYTTIYVENRYIWPSFILLSLVGFAIMQNYYSKFFSNKIRWFIYSSLVIVSFIPFFIQGFTQQLPNTVSHKQAKLIKSKYGIVGNFASTDHWGHSLFLTYFLDSKFFGTEKMSVNDSLLSEKAKKLGINYLIDYSTDSIKTKTLDFVGEIDSIRIFRINYEK